MNPALKNKKALVFAASEGIGLGIAKELVLSGAEVIIAARSEPRLQNATKEIGASDYLVGDLVVAGTGQQLVNQAINKLGKLDILVTNAGGPPKGYFKDVTENDWLLGFQSLFLAVTDSIKAALPSMEQNNWGRIICVTSTAAKEPIPKLTVSNALRAGLLGLINSLSKEIACSGITINALMPGYTQTNRLTELGIDLSELTKQIPARRLGTTTELGQLTAFLCSDAASFITGQAIAVDGGMLAAI